LSPFDSGIVVKKPHEGNKREGLKLTLINFIKE